MIREQATTPHLRPSPALAGEADRASFNARCAEDDSRARFFELRKGGNEAFHSRDDRQQ